MSIIHGGSSLAVAAATLIALSGCTSSPQTSIVGESRAATPVQTENDSVMSEIPDLLEFDTRDEDILATTTNAAEFIDASPFTPTTARIAVYSDCVGTGSMTIAISNVAQSTHECRQGSDKTAHRDEMDIDPNGSYSISVNTDAEQLWTVTVVSVLPQ
ncbi:hypothetical protein [Salinibacterium sp. NK8237]|uniref:hypothetical protein n=1 Tax=Salinibacterium sp. NK8237 TaxID=2792038 RepID=UPI0018CDD64A|nr:hypothetical protein [Salinibacterium sp. NK8237]MBH0128939.1 hypothetical protein [Salinibacterium sp. NK8237]